MINKIVPSKISPLEAGVNQGVKPKANPSTSFQKMLQHQLANQQLKFSAHAVNRLQQRLLPLDGQKLARLEKGVQQAAAKGARNSLVLVDELAFVVSVTNNTVITALAGENRQENVFTNIDSAVIA